MAAGLDGVVGTRLRGDGLGVVFNPDGGGKVIPDFTVFVVVTGETC